MMLLHRPRSTGSSGPWLPTTDSAVYWFDAQDTASMFTDTAGTTPVSADAQAIARWNNKGSAADNAIQATSGDRPTYRTSSAINTNKAGVRVPGGTAGGNPNAGMDITGNFGALNELQCNGATSGLVGFGGASSAAVNVGPDCLVSIQWTAGAGTGTVKWFSGGTQVGSTTTGLTLADSGIFAFPVDMLTAGNFSAGRIVTPTRLFNRAADGRGMDGDIGDIIYFNTQSDTLRQKVEGYLAHKYGFTLPGGHPYAVSPP